MQCAGLLLRGKFRSGQLHSCFVRFFFCIRRMRLRRASALGEIIFQKPRSAACSSDGWESFAQCPRRETPARAPRRPVLFLYTPDAPAACFSIGRNHFSEAAISGVQFRMLGELRSMSPEGNACAGSAPTRFFFVYKTAAGKSSSDSGYLYSYHCFAIRPRGLRTGRNRLSEAALRRVLRCRGELR